MKLLGVLILILSANSWAAKKIEGKYEQKKIIETYMYRDSKTCTDDGGQWEPSSEVCSFETADTVVIKGLASNRYTLNVSTVGNNMHSCEFEAEAVIVGNSLISRVDTEVYNHETGDLEKAICEVKAEISANKKFVTISSNDKCSEFCGANAWLDTSALKKVK